MDNDNGGCGGDPNYKVEIKKQCGSDKGCCKNKADSEPKSIVKGGDSCACNGKNDKKSNISSGKGCKPELISSEVNKGSKNIVCSKCKEKNAQIKYRNDPCCL